MLVWVSSGGGGGGYTVTNSGLWTICVFRVMTFKRPGITFKASEYLLVMNFDYFVPISFICYITRLHFLEIQFFFKNPSVCLGS